MERPPFAASCDAGEFVGADRSGALGQLRLVTVSSPMAKGVRLMQSPLSTVERYQKVAAEYSDFAKTASSPFLRAYYRHTGEEYRLRADRGLGKRTRVGGDVAAAIAASLLIFDESDLCKGVSRPYSFMIAGSLAGLASQGK
jgi:hypothetical protein